MPNKCLVVHVTTNSPSNYNNCKDIFRPLFMANFTVVVLNDQGPTHKTLTYAFWRGTQQDHDVWKPYKAFSIYTLTNFKTYVKSNSQDDRCPGTLPRTVPEPTPLASTSSLKGKEKSKRSVGLLHKERFCRKSRCSALQVVGTGNAAIAVIFASTGHNRPQPTCWPG